ncbi:uS10/mL48 family ribosomal protein [Halomarina ordinaria]|uniref:Small ribosomal subunit protein uS10 n=1 Tax=Halomarina ordinaria TaxID=3033939 RepID=A0ABD5U7U9_9EURY|nr:uS10/mL48 family ribosomal protein [Halomarina sp. PSRA2]
MTFVTTLTLTSGNRHVLEDVVGDIKTTAERKGAELKGPHPAPPADYRVPLSKRLDDGDSFDPWEYTVYKRTVRIVGHDGFARQASQREFPDDVHVEVEVEQVTNAGR